MAKSEQAPATGWRRLVPPGATFSIELPAEPDVKPPGEEHPILGAMREVSAKVEGSIGCKVQYSTLHKVPQPEYAMDFLQRLVSPPPGMKSRPISWSGHPGLEIIGPGFIGRSFVAGSELVLLMSVALGDKPDADAAKRFVESLEFGAGKPDAKVIQFGRLVCEMPEGWELETAEGSILVVRSSAKENADRFTLTASSAEGATLDEQVARVLVALGPGVAQRRFEIGSVSAAELSDGEGPRVLVVHDDVLYVIVARYAPERATVVGTVAAAFVKSLRFPAEADHKPAN